MSIVFRTFLKGMAVRSVVGSIDAKGGKQSQLGRRKPAANFRPLARACGSRGILSERVP